MISQEQFLKEHCESHYLTVLLDYLLSTIPRVHSDFGIVLQKAFEAGIEYQRLVTEHKD